MKDKALFIWIYAAILLIGGIIGFVQAGSLASIIMAALFALIFISCGYAVWNQISLGYDVALGALVCLTLFFGYRFFLTYRVMPAGLMAILSLLFLIYLGMSRKV